MVRGEVGPRERWPASRPAEWLFQRIVHVPHMLLLWLCGGIIDSPWKAAVRPGASVYVGLLPFPACGPRSGPGVLGTLAGPPAAYSVLSPTRKGRLSLCSCPRVETAWINPNRPLSREPNGGGGSGAGRSWKVASEAWPQKKGPAVL